MLALCLGVTAGHVAWSPATYAGAAVSRSHDESCAVSPRSPSGLT